MEVFSGSQKFILVAITAGVMWHGLACLPLAMTQTLHGKQMISRWMFVLSSRNWGYMGNVVLGAPCSRS